jgi:choline dehydrogenase-like flavoprotein
VTFSFSDNDRRLMKHSDGSMRAVLEAAGARNLWSDRDSSHQLGTCRMGDDPADSVTNADGRTWAIPNLWICDGSLFPTSGGVNPSLTIQALACRIGDRIAAMAKRGELDR